MVPQRMRETTGYLVAQTCKRFRFRAHSLLAEVGLHRGQHFILRSLWEQEGLTHSELAEQSRVRPATITNALKRMERAGFVERRPDPEDQRVSRVYLTDAGRGMRERVEAVWSTLEAQAFAGFTPEEREQLEHLLQRLIENLDREIA